jgi:serine-type D-Ala-D-Ala carboxypeptidase (penicillin-binding protein 5/6)
MIRRITTVAVLVFFLLQAVALAAPPQVVTAPPQISAEAAVLMVAKTQRVLFGKNQYGTMYPASTTKIVTLLTAMELGNMDSVVTVGRRAAACEESRLGLRAGDKLTLRELLTGMMVVSGNDAAEAVAEHIAGSVPKFVNLMNAKADKMGSVNTHFSNPHGLPDPVNHYSTAYDLARFAAVGMQNPEFARIVSLPSYTVNFLNRPPLPVTTTNKFLKQYPGANGVKTGYTEAAGDCLVAGAKRGDVQLIVVLLNDDYRWEDAAKLLDYGFQLTAAN